MITEAILCDCPVVLVENEFFDGRTLAEFELGLDGYANTNSEEDLDRARSGIEQGKKNFIDAVNNFWDQLEFFIEETQRFSKKRSKGEVSLDLMSASWMTNKYLKKNLKRYLSYKIKRILGKDKVK